MEHHHACDIAREKVIVAYDVWSKLKSKNKECISATGEHLPLLAGPKDWIMGLVLPCL